MDRQTELAAVPSVVSFETQRIAAKILLHLHGEGERTPLRHICHQLLVLSESDPLDTAAYLVTAHLRNGLRRRYFPPQPEPSLLTRLTTLIR